MTEQEAQQLFKKFLEDNGLKFVVYVLAPRTGTLVPIEDFLLNGWRMVAVKMVIKDGNDKPLPTS